MTVTEFSTRGSEIKPQVVIDEVKQHWIEDCLITPGAGGTGSNRDTIVKDITNEDVDWSSYLRCP